MGVCKKCALLDTDFLYKTHLARNKDHHTLADFVLDFEDYDFFCHEMIREELTRHQIQPDPNPWLEDKIREGRIYLCLCRKFESYCKNTPSAGRNQWKQQD